MNASTTSGNSARCQTYYGMQNLLVEPPTPHSSDNRIDYAACTYMLNSLLWFALHYSALKFGPLLYIAGMHKYILEHNK